MPDIITGSTVPSELVRQVLNATWDLGLTKATASATRVNNALTELASPPTMSASSVAVPSVTEPVVTIPTDQEADAFNKFDSLYPELIDALSAEFATFISTYLPAQSASLAAYEAWLLDAMQNPDAVLPPALAAEIWEGDRSRVNDAASQAVEAVAATWASRGFPVPPGVAVAQAYKIQEAAITELANSSRNVAVKSFEMAYDKLKFAVTQMGDMRTKALSAAGDYIKALASGPDVASRVVGIGYDAQSKLISAVSSFYSARIDAEKLAYSARQHNADFNQAAALENLKAIIDVLGKRVSTILSDAQSTSHMAASLFNNAHVQASMSGSFGIGYHYNNDTQNEAPTLVAVGV